MKRDYRHSPPNPPDGEPIDALLGAFFRSEMPAPWPAFRRPAPARLPLESARAARRPTSAARLALAASVALLFVGSWLLPKFAPRATEGQTLPIIGPASAGRGGVVAPHLHPEKSGTPMSDEIMVDEATPSK